MTSIALEFPAAASLPVPFHVLRLLLLLYVEESGVPIFVPGDVILVYSGHQTARDPVALVGAWVLAVLAVTLGATNLYLLSRWLGRRLVTGRLALVLHLTPERVESAEKSFRRWGPWALVFGRHIPGARIPITVAAGVLEVPYPLFAGCVAVSSAIWAAAWLAAGVAFGDRVAWLFDRFQGLGYLALGLLVVATVVYFFVRWRSIERA